MITIIVILVFASVLLGMFFSVKAFGTGSKRAKILKTSISASKMSMI